MKWRAFIWAVSEGLLLLSVIINRLPPKLFSAVFKFSMGLMMLDFFLCVIWLPIGVSKTYGFRDAKDVFTLTCKYIRRIMSEVHIKFAPDNGTGAPPAWNWILSLWVSGSHAVQGTCLIFF